MSIYSADDQVDDDNGDNGIRKGGHGLVMKQDDDGHGVTKDVAIAKVKVRSK